VHVGVVEFALVAVVVLFGSLVQGSIGFGLNLLGAPFVAIIVPEAVPATMVLLAAPLAITTFVREHHAYDRIAMPWMLAGAIPGTAGGLVIVDQVSGPSLGILVGAITLTGVALSAASPPVPVTPSTSLVAGLMSNLFGTASSVGGPPVALLLQHRAGPVARATLGGFFSVSATLSLIGYLATGVLGADQVLLALGLVPFIVAGLWASRHLHPFVDAGWLRPAVLGLSAAAGVTAILHGAL
jgi:uncharacterized membrane protein YfcA